MSRTRLLGILLRFFWNAVITGSFNFTRSAEESNDGSGLQILSHIAGAAGWKVPLLKKDDSTGLRLGEMKRQGGFVNTASNDHDIGI